jgi:cupin 2 domain-containing protein
MGRCRVKHEAQMQRNLFSGSAPPAAGERLDVLLAHRNLVIERIVSSSLVTATTYVQPQDEWVLLVRGEAQLDVAGEAVALEAGDHLFLPSGTEHTVKSASDGALWLAVHLHAS